MRYKFVIISIFMISTLTGQSPQIERFYSTLGNNLNSKTDNKVAALRELLLRDSTFIEAHVELAKVYVNSEKYRDANRAAEHIFQVVELIKLGKKPTIKTNERYLLATCGKLFLDYYYFDKSRNTDWLNKSIQIFKLALDFSYALWADYNNSESSIDSDDAIKNSISDAYENLGGLMMWSNNYFQAFINFQAAYTYLVKTDDMSWKAYYLQKQAKISKVLSSDEGWVVLTVYVNDQLKDVEIITNESELYFYMRNSIKKTGDDSFKIWLMLVKISDMFDKTVSKHDHIKLLVEFDSKRELTRIIEFIEYDINGNVLPNSKIHNPDKWTNLVPGSIFMKIYEKFKNLLNN